MHRKEMVKFANRNVRFANFTFHRTARYYEDESGKEYEETVNFTTTIKTPFSNTVKETPEATGQWWIIMAAIGGILLCFVLVMILRGIRRKRQQDEMEDTGE